MPTKRGLGRGLGALIPDRAQEKETVNESKQSLLRETKKKTASSKKSSKKTAKKEVSTAGKASNQKKEKKDKNSVQSGSPLKEKVQEVLGQSSVEPEASFTKLSDEKSDTTSQGAKKKRSEQAETREDQTSLDASKGVPEVPEILENPEVQRASMLPIDRIQPDPKQPRHYFEEQALADLASSIRQYGILQPLVVRKEEDHYILIAGERRYRAAQLAELREVPVILRDEKEDRPSILSIIENIQREDLTPIEEAQAYQNVMREQWLTQQELANLLGKSRPYVANILRLLQLDEKTMQALQNGQLTSSQARSLLSVPEGPKRDLLREQLVSGTVTVNEVERKVNKRKKPIANAFIQDLETRFVEALGTKVSIEKKRKGFAVQVYCYSDDDLQALIERLEG